MADYTNMESVIVTFPNADVRLGRVIGLQSEYPAIGKIYIVLLDEPVNDTYPWSGVCVPEGCLAPTRLQPGEVPF